MASPREMTPSEWEQHMVTHLPFLQWLSILFRWEEAKPPPSSLDDSPTAPFGHCRLWVLEGFPIGQRRALPGCVRLALQDLFRDRGRHEGP